ncbi:MAG: glucose-6-phosphate dehydrogenase, partial [Elusimicrobiota bacterium]
DESFQQKMRVTLMEGSGKIPAQSLNEFIPRCHYISGDYSDPSLYAELAQTLKKLDAKYKNSGNRIFYLATPPSLYETVVERMGAVGLTTESDTGSPWVRVVVEKPFGRDLGSAMQLARVIHKHLSERQIYLIDHYLGKETVQNILVFRFANTIFEPVWNRRYIDHVQITLAENIGVEHRAGYFEQAGQMRDMFQNHMLEMLTLMTMEPPASFEADRVRDEKVKVLRAVRPFPLDDLDNHIVRGQYGSGWSEGKKIESYREEEGVSKKSQIDTYVAAKFFIDNWRWHGVPFYLRTGKRMAKRVSEIAIAFKEVPHAVFPKSHASNAPSNSLILNVQPEEGIALTIQAKEPGPKINLSPLVMDFHYREVFGTEPPEAYERLLLDCMLGDQTLFIRQDMMQVAWTLITPVLETWESSPNSFPLYIYPPGKWGPSEADKLLEGDASQWRTP